MSPKKTIYDLREQMLDAQEHFQRLRFEDDHIICIFSYKSKFRSDLPEKKQKLKDYIMSGFDGILFVDIFSEYFVVWHDFVFVADEHRISNTPYYPGIEPDENDQ